jgi:hypothetical protein
MLGSSRRRARNNKMSSSRICRASRCPSYTKLPLTSTKVKGRDLRVRTLTGALSLAHAYSELSYYFIARCSLIIYSFIHQINIVAIRVFSYYRALITSLEGYFVQGIISLYRSTCYP